MPLPLKSADTTLTCSDLPKLLQNRGLPLSLITSSTKPVPSECTGVGKWKIIQGRSTEQKCLQKNRMYYYYKTWAEVESHFSEGQIISGVMCGPNVILIVYGSQRRSWRVSTARVRRRRQDSISCKFPGTTICILKSIMLSLCICIWTFSTYRQNWPFCSWLALRPSD